MANQVEKLNGIAIGSIEKFNGATDSNIEKINGLEFTGSFSAAYSLTEIGSVTDTKRGYGSFTTYDPNTDQHLHVYGDNGNSNYGTIDAIIKTSSTYYRGTPYVYHSSTCIFNMAIYDATKQRVVVAFETFISGDSTGYYPRIFTANVGAKQSSTNPYDFASGDFTETDSSTATVIDASQTAMSDANTGSIRFFDSNFMSYNEAYDVYMLTYNHDGGFSGNAKKEVRAFYVNSNGSLTAGDEVEFDDYDDRRSCPVYDANISRTVLMYNDGSSSGKIRVVKHVGTGSVADRVNLSLDSEISHYQFPTGTKGGYHGVFAQYYPESTCIFHFTGSTDVTGVRYFKLTGSDGGGYSKVSGDGYNDDVQNLWYYLEAPGDNQADHGGASMHYVKGRGRLVVLFVDDDVASISGSYDAQAKGSILEWNTTRAAADAQQRVEDIMLGYTGSLGGGVITLSHTHQPAGYGSAYNGTAWWTMGAYGETNVNERPEGLFGTITMDGGFNDQWMLKFLEPGTTGNP
jgi:hypothetical protein